MKKKTNILIILFVLGIFLINTFPQTKIAQTGFQFLSVVSDARGAAMGDAMTSLECGSSALFFNPAGMADMHGLFDISGSTNKWIADITHTTFAVAFKPLNGEIGVFGLTAQYVNYGDFYGTVVDAASTQGYDDTGIFHLSAYALGIGYAKQLTDKFSVGGQIKYVHQDLGSSTIAVFSSNDTTREVVTNKLSPLAFDFGTQFRTGVKSLVFGMSVRNFSTQVKYATEGFQAPLVFTLGISMNVLDLVQDLPFNQSLLVCVDASHYADHPEQVKVGLDYKILNLVSLRGGYTSSNDLGGLSFGLGITQYGFTIDYAYSPYGVFNNVQRFTARFAL
jgi:hypothetical protein